MKIMNNDLEFNSDIPFGRGIALEPFLHQVAGRATMMCLNETTVCKPLNYREHFFYKSLPPDILQFTPRFKGVVNVNIEETPDGSVALTAFPYEPQEDTDGLLNNDDDEINFSHCNQLQMGKNQMSVNQSKSVHSMIHSPCKRIRLKRTGSLYMDEELDEEQCCDQETISSTWVVNPWIFKVHKEGLKRQLKSRSRVVQKCILLENVASQFRRPCVLDLKMGTRIHGDYDDNEKKLRHERKCAETTTQKLGVRLSGMQVFNASSGKFLCRDKYFGRGLDKASLRSTLHQFFHDGHRTRHELILPVLKRLSCIRDSLKRLRTYRFYSSSLLIMYDGDSPNVIDSNRKTKASEKEPAHQNVTTGVNNPAKNSEACLNERKIADLHLTPELSNLHTEADSCSNDAPSPDVTETNTSSYCQSHSSDTFTQPSSPVSCSACQAMGASYSSDTASSMSERSPTLPDSSTGSQSHPDISSIHVDIRMIDFAKSTHSDMDSSVVHDGPDHGYIFGLTNLIQLLQDIYEINVSSELANSNI